MIFIDTNFFLRFLLNDVEIQHKEAEEFFVDASEGKFTCFTSSIVVFEVYWVVSGQFDKQKDKVIDVMRRLLQLYFIEIEHAELIGKAISIYEKSSLGLVDCFNIVFSENKKATNFKTFDKALIRKLYERS